MKSVLILTVVLLASWGYALPSKDKMTKDVDYLTNLIAYSYGPQYWKQSHFGWSLLDEANKVKAQINASSSTQLKDYQKMLSQLFFSTRDYHVGHGYNSTESATLGFTVKTIENKVIIVHIDRKKLPSTIFNFNVGDEIISWNGHPIAEEYALLMHTNYTNTAVTDLAWTDLLLTKRVGYMAMDVPNGLATIEIKNQNDQSIQVAVLNWQYTPELISDIPDHQFFSLKGDNLKNELSKLKLSNPTHIKFMQESQDQDSPNPYGLGQRKSFIPTFGTPIWESDESNQHYAYIFESNGKKIGYIRLSSYTPEIGSDFSAQMFGEILNKFEKETDGLIIDQVNNPGGSVLYLYSLVSMFVNQPAYAPHHKMILNQKMVLEAYSTLEQLKNIRSQSDIVANLGTDSIEGYQVDMEFIDLIRGYEQFIIDQSKAGKVLSEPFYLYGVNKIKPHPRYNYSKPVFILTNELDFSGGDFFPATMQDNQRAFVIGGRTAGAGGYVQSYDNIPNTFGLSYFSLTGSIAERIDKNPIENLGVTPDYNVNLTVDDITQGFKNYKKSVLDFVQTKLP